MNTELPELSMSSTSAGPPASMLTSKGLPPHVYTLSLRLTRNLDEVRAFYALQLCSLRRRGTTSPADEGSEAAKTTTVPSKLLGALAALMEGQVLLVDKGVIFDGVLSKMV